MVRPSKAAVKKEIKARSKNKGASTGPISKQWMAFTALFGVLVGVAALLILDAPISHQLPLSFEIRGILADLRQKLQPGVQRKLTDAFVPAADVTPNLDSVDVAPLQDESTMTTSKSAPIDVVTPDYTPANVAQSEVVPDDITNPGAASEETASRNFGHEALPEDFLQQSVPADSVMPDTSGARPQEQAKVVVTEAESAQVLLPQPFPADFVAPDISGAMPAKPAQVMVPESTPVRSIKPQTVPAGFVAPDISRAKPVEQAEVVLPDSPPTLFTNAQPVPADFIAPDISEAIPVKPAQGMLPESVPVRSIKPQPVPADFVVPDISGAKPVEQKEAVLSDSASAVLTNAQQVPVDFVATDISGAIPVELAQVVLPDSAPEFFANAQPVAADFFAPDISGARPVVRAEHAFPKSAPTFFANVQPAPADFVAPDISGARPVDRAGSILEGAVPLYYEIAETLSPEFVAAISGAEPMGSKDECVLGELCTPSQARPLLADGSESRAIWDKPRALMKSNFASGSAKVSYVWVEPLVVYFDNVLDESELNYIVDTATPRFAKSMVAGPNGIPISNPARNSDTAWIFVSESEKVRQILHRISNLVGFGVENAEDIGVNRYEKSQFFSPHYDYMEEHQLNAFGEFRNCQRSATVLIYLSDVEEGGHSVFIREKEHNFEYKPGHPDHLAVQPKRGRVLAWFNMHPYTEKVDDRTLHAGSPVEKGTKIAATIFLRNCTRSPMPVESDEL